MKKLLMLLGLCLMTLPMYSFGFKIRMDETYTSRVKNGEIFSSDTIPAKSIITINADAGWIYFDTGNTFFRIEDKTDNGWLCYDPKGGEATIEIVRDGNDAYLTIAFGDRMWGGRITKEKPVWRNIRKPFGYVGKIRPERMPLYIW